jgi:hypothetical protein
MRFKPNTSTLACIVVFFSCWVSVVNATIISGEISIDDLLATDRDGSWQYDYYNFVNNDASSVVVDISLTAGSGFAPYMYYWFAEVLPAPNWNTPIDLWSSVTRTGTSVLGGTRSFTSFDLASSGTLQIAVSSYNYWDGSVDQVGSFGEYTLTVSEGPVLVSEVPEPSSLTIFALGLMGLASLRFKKLT